MIEDIENETNVGANFCGTAAEIRDANSAAKARVQCPDPLTNHVMAMVPIDDPLCVAWETYKRTAQFPNDLKWARIDQHTEGALWSAFSFGFTMGMPKAPIGSTKMTTLRNWFVAKNGEQTDIYAKVPEESRTITIVRDVRPDTANMIAAAPDLFNALMQMYREKREYMRLNNLGDPGNQTDCKAARLALNKAMGIVDDEGEPLPPGATVAASNVPSGHVSDESWSG